MTKTEYFEKNGFSAEGVTYVVVGEDTYAIKDWLKEQGCRYSPLLKWHSPAIFQLPEGFQWVMFSFENIMEWSDKEENALYIEGVEAKIQASINLAMPQNKSEFMGRVGERLRNLTAILKSKRSFNGQYGLTYVYTFKREEDILTWFTQKELEINEGAVVDLTGTVKAHDLYQGVQQTRLQRCIIKEVC